MVFKASVNGLKNVLPVLGIVSQLVGHPDCADWLSADQMVISQGISTAYSNLSIFMNVQFLVKLPTVLSHFI